MKSSSVKPKGLSSYRSSIPPPPPRQPQTSGVVPRGVRFETKKDRLWFENKKWAVPKNSAQELSQIAGAEDAKKFVKSAGFTAINYGPRPAAFGVDLDIPEEVKQIAEESSTIKHLRPQIVLPTAGDVIPPGTVLMNFLIPHISDPAETEDIFTKYQEMTIKLADRLGARPFACITGYREMKKRRLSLYELGFRFFFSGQPDDFYGRINLLLRARAAYYSIPATNKRKKNACIKAMQKLEMGRYRPHPILGDIVLFSAQTTLIDMRE
jgi:hypothetical protein